MDRLDNKNRLVDTYTKIFNLLYKENHSVNTIINQTSSDRTYIIKTVKELEKGKFIENIKSESHKQKKVKKLTLLGRELANLTINIENFNEEFFKLLQIRDDFVKLDEEIEKFQEREFQDIHSTIIKKTYLDIIKDKDKKKINSERILKMKLKEKNWTDTEINYYEECKNGIYYTIISLPEGLIKVLLQKFLSILDIYDINVVAREIINKIVIEIFQVQLSTIVTNIHNRYTKYLTKYKKNDNDKIDYSSYYPSFKYEPLEYVEKLRFPFSSSVIRTIEKLIRCYLILLKPPKKIIEHNIIDMKKNIENSPSYETDEGDINREELMMSFRCLIIAYEEYLKSN